MSEVFYKKGIYKISFIGDNDGNSYIGKTTVSFKKRFSQHLRTFEKGICSPRFREMIEMYGIENVVFEIIAFTSDNNKIHSLETFLINKKFPSLNFETRRLC